MLIEQTSGFSMYLYSTYVRNIGRGYHRRPGGGFVGWESVIDGFISSKEIDNAV